LREGLRVPGDEEWRGYKDDLDVKYAHKLFYGKTILEVQEYFGNGWSIDRADELLFMPRRAFQYYVLAFDKFVKSKEAKGDSDSASSFMHLLINREKKDPGSVSSIFDQLEEAVAFVSVGQVHFDAPIDIYGRFSDLGDELIQLVKAGG
jgi:hypothetical protein